MPRPNLGVACALTLIWGVGASPVHAAEIAATAQAVAAHAEWLPFAPAPATPAAVCLVDTGVNLNADVASVVTQRVALDGGTVDDVDGNVHHGTLMAMVAAAAINGQGMVGAAPQNRIVSVRSATAPAPGTVATSPYDRFSQGIRECLKTPTDNVRVVELALGSGDVPTPTQDAEMADQVIKAHAKGVSVVAAAGNDGGAVNDPASAPGVVSVAAADRAGVFCSFSARGTGLDVLAPGCELETADPVSLAPSSGQGTSEASAFFASVLAALRAYRPNLSWDAAEQLLLSTAPNGVLNVEAAFRAADLGGLVDAGRAAMPAPPQAQVPTASAGSSTPATVAPAPTTPAVQVTRPRPWATPKATVRWRNGVVSVVVRNVPRMAVVRVELQRRRGRKFVVVNSRQGRENIWRLRAASRPARVAIMFVDLTGTGHDSRVRHVSKFLR